MKSIIINPKALSVELFMAFFHERRVHCGLYDFIIVPSITTEYHPAGEKEFMLSLMTCYCGGNGEVIPGCDPRQQKRFSMDHVNFNSVEPADHVKRFVEVLKEWEEESLNVIRAHNTAKKSTHPEQTLANPGDGEPTFKNYQVTKLDPSKIKE